MQQESHKMNMMYIYVTLMYYMTFWHYGGILYILCLTLSDLTSSFLYWLVHSATLNRKYIEMFNKIILALNFIDAKIYLCYCASKLGFYIFTANLYKYSFVKKIATMHGKVSKFINKITTFKTRDIEMKKIEAQIIKLNEMNKVINKYDTDYSVPNNQDIINSMVDDLCKIDNDE